MKKAEKTPAKRQRGRPKLSTAPLVSSVAAQASRDLSEVSSVRSGYLEALPDVEVQVPWVPPYVPATRPARDVSYWRDDFSNHTARQLNGSVISRFTKDNGFISFTVRVGSEDDKAGKVIDVDLAKIYDHVTPEELERFENLDWEEEIEREKNRPKVGRPRKELPTGGVSSAILPNTTKKPLGRPRKYPLKAAGPVTQGQRDSGKHVDSAFLGVHVPSPVRPGQRTVNSSSPISLTPLPQLPNHSRQEVSTPSSHEAMSTSAEGDNPMQIDQLTPSNAKRVTGVRIPPKSPSERTQRASYPMVEAALGKSDYSDVDEAVPESESEDELALKPSTEARRFTNGVEIPNSRSGTEDYNESHFVSEAASPQDQSSQDNDRKSMRSGSDSRSIVFIDESADSDTPEDILEKFKASNARRIYTGPAENIPSARPRSKFIDQYFQSKPVAQAPMSSMTSQQPSASSSSRASPRPHPQIKLQKSASALSHRTTAPSQASVSTQCQHQQLKTPRQPKPQGKVGTNVHSAVAGISTTNALSLLRPPPPNAGRGPENYRHAKPNSEALGEPFLDVDNLASRPPGVPLQPGEIGADLLPQTLLSNRGMKLHEARIMKREAQLKAQQAADEAAGMLENIAARARGPVSNLATAFSARPEISDRLPPAPSTQPSQHAAFSSSRQVQPHPVPSPHETTPKQSHQSRKSMTPHFPPSRPRHQGTISPVLRGGINHLAASNGSPVKFSRHPRASDPTTRDSLIDNRDKKPASFATRTKSSPPVDDAGIKLGSPITTSDEEPDSLNHRTATSLRPPQLAKPNITLGSPETSPSSSENTHQPRSAQTSGKSNIPNGDQGRKRRRSSDGSRDAERPWY
ncbi:MAG: hypothetical protein Q9184_006595 [Pyrenodesmia sp. 2 TL-2023]